MVLPLKTVRPQNVVISVGPNNYGHPTSTALNLYRSVGATIYRTDLNGTVTVQPGGVYSIATERGAVSKGAATPAAPSRSATVSVVPARPASVTYKSYAEARAAGAAPLLRG